MDMEDSFQQPQEEYEADEIEDVLNDDLSDLSLSDSEVIESRRYCLTCL